MSGTTTGSSSAAVASGLSRGASAVRTRRSTWRRVRGLALHLLVLTICAVMLFPVVWALSSSFKPQNEILKYPPVVVPSRLSLEGYQRVMLSSSRMLRYMVNTFFLAFSSSTAATVIAALAGYSFSRFRFVGRDALFVAFLGVIMIPGLTNLIPLYAMFSRWGLLNTYECLILIYTAGHIPFATWIMKSFYDSIPRELEDAALVDGCDRIRLLVRITLPLAVAGVAAIFIMSFVGIWNEFMTNLIMTSKDELRNVSVGLYNFLSFYGVDYQSLNAAAVLVMIPVVLVFIAGRRHFLGAMLEGALKGI